ncbi:MAG: quinone-dependent dihydroorotate dehydrogenase [Candidatus Fonsibacter sp.]|nr:quinone-dependent dihydroorotate dehydrogenase [Candidatus Fonsibacter sp.]
MNYQIINSFINKLDPELAHSLAIQFLKNIYIPLFPSKDDEILKINILGKEFSNPIGLAAGFDKNAEVYDKIFALGFGFAEVGTITPRPQEGNPKPRVFRLIEDKAIINRLGFPNQGLTKIKTRIETKKLEGILGINIGPNKDSVSRIDDYVECFKNFHNLCSYICVNISSPNTENLRNFHQQENLKKLLSEISNIKNTLNSKTPIFLKISPDIDDDNIVMICKNILEFNLGGLVLTNTSIKLRDNLLSKQKDEIGGLSGTSIKETSNLIIKKFFKIVKRKVPIIGVGGIDSGISAYEKIRAGASLLQLYTGLVYKGPFVIRAIKQELAELLKRDGFASLQEAVGVDSE